VAVQREGIHRHALNTSRDTMMRDGRAGPGARRGRRRGLYLEYEAARCPTWARCDMRTKRGVPARLSPRPHEEDYHGRGDPRGAPIGGDKFREWRLQGVKDAPKRGASLPTADGAAARTGVVRGRGTRRATTPKRLAPEKLHRECVRAKRQSLFSPTTAARWRGDRRDGRAELPPTVSACSGTKKKGRSGAQEVDSTWGERGRNGARVAQNRTSVGLERRRRRGPFNAEHQSLAGPWKNGKDRRG